MTLASEAFLGRSARGVLATRLPLIFPVLLLGGEPLSVFKLTLDVVDATEVVLDRGTGGTSSSDFALWNDRPETSDTREVGLEALEMTEDLGVALLVPAVLLLGSTFTLRVLVVVFGPGLMGEATVVELVAVVVPAPRLMVEVVDLTDAAIDFGRPAAGLSVAVVVLVPTIRLAGTFRAGGTWLDTDSFRWFALVLVTESNVADLENVAPVSFWFPATELVSDDASGLTPLLAEEKEDESESRSLVSVVDSRVRDNRTVWMASLLVDSAGGVALDLA